MFKHPVIILVYLCILGGCSSSPKNDQSYFRNRDYDYRFAKETSPTKIPPGLSDKEFVDFYPVPKLNSADEQFVNDLTMPPAQVVTDQARVKLQKLGNSEWLLIRSSPSQIWPVLKDFILNEQLVVAFEQGDEGILKTKKRDGQYNFDLRQGFQRNTAELTLHYKPAAAMPNSEVMAIERDYLKKVGTYFSETLDKPSYSYVARGISTEKRMQLIHDKQFGDTLLLTVSHVRAVASVKRALESSSFRIKDTVNGKSNTTFKATYYPVVDSTPGFFAKLFGTKAKGLDEAVPYAGKHFDIKVVTEAGSGKEKVYFTSETGAALSSINESRDMTAILKRHLI